jgi:5'-nucleotidase
MEAWWTDAETAMVQEGITKGLFYKILRGSKLELRKGCNEYFSTLEANAVPLLIFSAGIGDVIVDTMKNHNQSNRNLLEENWTLQSNIHIISNFMKWNDDGRLIGFQGTLSANSIGDSVVIL